MYLQRVDGRRGDAALPAVAAAWARRACASSARRRSRVRGASCCWPTTRASCWRATCCCASTTRRERRLQLGLAPARRPFTGGTASSRRLTNEPTSPASVRSRSTSSTSTSAPKHDIAYHAVSGDGRPWYVQIEPDYGTPQPDADVLTPRPELRAAGDHRLRPRARRRHSPVGALEAARASKLEEAFARYEAWGIDGTDGRFSRPRRPGDDRVDRADARVGRPAQAAHPDPRLVRNSAASSGRFPTCSIAKAC